MATNRRTESKMITTADLVDGHTLSFTQQPNLRELFRRLTDTDKPTTFVVGAGVSMNAGLPSWTQLLNAMTKYIPDPRFQRMAASDPADPMRKAEYIRQLVLARTKMSSVEVVRDSLFKESADVPPGDLAVAIAKVIASNPRRFRVFTTNFDGVMEAAIRGYVGEDRVDAVGLDEVERGVLDTALDVVKVVHLHGKIEANDQTSIEPIILTESEFLREGPRVRRIISDEMKRADVIFVGVSLTDPNLVGPLWDLSEFPAAKTATARFALVVPGLEPGSEDQDESYEYSLEKAHYLEQLSTSPIFLKSYSQLIQAVSDMSLAVVEPARYRARVPATTSSTRYGKRFSVTLDRAYEQIGCSTRNDLPDRVAGDNVSELLHNALHSTAGPVAYLRKVRRKLQRRKIQLAPVGDEHFALFLWLRVRGHGGGPAPYAIHLIGSSAYSHRARWSLDRHDRIGPSSNTVAATAVYRGSSQATNLVPTTGTHIWRGVVAVPLDVYKSVSDACLPGSQEPLDRLTVGAVTLNSTHYILGETTAAADDLSVIHRIASTDDMFELTSRMQSAAASILFPDETS